MREYDQLLGGFLHIDIVPDGEEATNISLPFIVPQVLIESTSFVNGLANRGGAIYSKGFTNIEIRSSYFEYNRAFELGGAIFIQSFYRARLIIDTPSNQETRFLFNIAGTSGSNVFIEDYSAPYGTFDNSDLSNKILA